MMSDYNYKDVYEQWVNNPLFGQETKDELLAIKDDEKEIEERFYCDLVFGTAGLRGIIGAASVPVHAPVPGSGIPTNSRSAIYTPVPDFAMSFCPPCSPFTRHHVKNLPMNLLSFPHSSTRLANQYINGTGIILPMTHTINDGILGSPKPTEYGMAPRSSSIGTMDIRNIVRYFFNITILSFNFQVRL